MVVLACCPDDLELDPRWMPLLLSYNGLLASTGRMELTGNHRFVMQLPVTGADDDVLASLTHNFLQLVRECCQAATAAPHSMTMMSAIKG